MIAMSRAEHYCAGRAEGERWAEQEAESQVMSWWAQTEMREEATLALANRRLSSTHENHAAFLLGRARGYRLYQSQI